jgi:hypothetical protein
MYPPQKPINNQHSYFELLCYEAQKYLPYKLDFDGYEDLVARYRLLSDLDTAANFEMAKEFVTWLEYFSNVANFVQKEFLDAETDKLQIFSAKSIDASDKSVASGDRKANTEPEVIAARKKRNALKSLYDALCSHQDFCEKVFYQCKYNCMESGDNTNGKQRRSEF